MSQTTADRLRTALERIVADTLDLTRGIRVLRLERDLGSAYIATDPDFHFDACAPSGGSGDAPLALEGSG